VIDSHDSYNMQAGLLSGKSLYTRIALIFHKDGAASGMTAAE
jgi:hypothetical protein